MHDAQSGNDWPVVTMHKMENVEHEGFRAMHCL
jgi:hypothetical protein